MTTTGGKQNRPLRRSRARRPVSSAAQTTAGCDARPRGSVPPHRMQVTLTRSRRSLVSLCEKSDHVSRALCEPSLAFDDRFVELMDTHVYAWGRTTCFDALLRAGVLGISGHAYRPE